MPLVLRHWSIATRMLVSALVLIVLALPVAGGLLSWNFREAVNTSFNDRLESLLNVVIAGVAYDTARDELVLEQALGEPRFERVYSGWYWQARDDAGREITSRSLWDQRLPVPDSGRLGLREIEGPRGQPLRIAARVVQLPNVPDDVRVSVALDLAGVHGEVARFQTLLAISLATLGLLLLLLIGFQIRWALHPLRRLETNLRAMEVGQRSMLDTDLPEELARLARAMNQVLEHDEVLIERGRAAAGNLAHALKTPVSVMQTLCESLPSAQQRAFREELRRLDEAVRHHLARASAAGPSALGRGVDIHDTLEPVLSALSTLAERRGIRITRTLAVTGSIAVEHQDLQEVVGNLMENAVNWAQSQVTVTIEKIDGGVSIVVEDDGPGMSESEFAVALDRGGKLDERRSGSGLGLAIVKDLVGLYRGTLGLAHSPRGGVRAEVFFPSR